jgi:hypothetical protein
MVTKMEFTCPKCGGHQYGVDKLDEETTIRYCYGIDPWFCTFKWPAPDDYLYIKAVSDTSADEELQHLRELVGSGEPVGVVTEFGGVEWFEPLPEGTFLYLRHYTKRDIAEAEAYTKQLSDKLRVE